jgi:AcrR family transcriptional regulator
MAVNAPVIDGRRVRGDRTRQAIVSRSAQLASAEGLEAVSLQRLASDLGISKSGLFAHFGSKEELQLATVEEAARIYTREVLKPGLSVPAGIGRLWAMCNAQLSYLERKVFLGGCFFESAAAEFAGRPGPVRDAVMEGVRYWAGSLARATRDAQALGEVDPEIDPDQLAWELATLPRGASRSDLIDGDNLGIERARRAIQDRLERVTISSNASTPDQ